MSQPISTVVSERINRELMTLKAGGIDVPAFLRSLFDAIASYRDIRSHLASGFEWDEEATDGLDFAYKSGRYHRGRGQLHTINAGVVTLADDDVNFVYLHPGTQTIEANTTGFETDRLPLFEVTTLGGAVTAVTRVLPNLMVIHDDVIGLNQLFPIHPLLDAPEALPPNLVEFEIGAELGNQIQINFDFYLGLDNLYLGGTRDVEIFLADAAGGWLTSTPPSVEFTSSLKLADIVAGKHIRARFNGGFTNFITIEHSGARTWYAGLIIGGQVFYSDAIVFS